jgi:hypothetical protein
MKVERGRPCVGLTGIGLKKHNCERFVVVVVMMMMIVPLIALS